MKRLGARWKEMGIVVLLMVLNILFIVQVVGIAYEPAEWMAFAQEYTGVTDSLILHPR